MNFLRRLQVALIRVLSFGRIRPLEWLTRYLLEFKATYAAIFLMGGTLFCGMLGSASLDMPVYQLFCALSALLGGSFVAGIILRPRLRLAGEIPDKATAGETLELRFDVRNDGRWTAREVGVRSMWVRGFMRRGEERAGEPFLRPGGTGQCAVALRFDRRGLYQAPAFFAFSAFPFRLWRSRARLTGPAPRRGSILALPKFHALESIEVPSVARHQPGGVALTSNVGESPEYIGSREYRPGDPIRHMDYRAWARLAQPVVREFREEYYIRMGLVLDTYVRPGTAEHREGFPALEGAVSMCAAVSDALSTGEYIIDLFAVGDELHVFRSGRHLAHHENVLEILACVEATKENPFESLAPALLHELEQVSTAVFIFLEWDDSRQRLVDAARASGCRTMTLLVAEEPPAGFAPSDPRAGDSVHVLSPKAIAAGEVRAL